MTKLTIKQRILLTFFLISAFSLYFFSDSINNSARRHYLEASEELMYDQVYTLRSLIYTLGTNQDSFALAQLERIYNSDTPSDKTTPTAKIYAVEKFGSDTSLYLTDDELSLIHI